MIHLDVIIIRITVNTQPNIMCRKLYEYGDDIIPFAKFDSSAFHITSHHSHYSFHIRFEIFASNSVDKYGWNFDLQYHACAVHGTCTNNSVQTFFWLILHRFV